MLLVRVVNFFYGLVLRAGFRVSYSPQAMRRNLELILGVSPKRLQSRYPVTYERLDLNGVPAELISSRSTGSCTLLYLHGGGYFMGSLRADRVNAAMLATHCDAQVAIIAYRLAPEDPYPAALEDAVRSYSALRERDPLRRIIICGDSAGGGLALALSMYLRDHGLPLPAGTLCISPWTDLQGSGSSVRTNHGRDVWLTRAHIKSWAPWYYGRHDPKSPYISPVFGVFEGLPPILALVGEDEILLDDSRRIASAAEAAGVAVELHVGNRMQHNWMLALPFLPASKEAWARITHFTKRVAV